MKALVAVAGMAVAGVGALVGLQIAFGAWERAALRAADREVRRP
jgi:hypothetical protein